MRRAGGRLPALLGLTGCLQAPLAAAPQRANGAHGPFAEASTAITCLLPDCVEASPSSAAPAVERGAGYVTVYEPSQDLTWRQSRLPVVEVEAVGDNVGHSAGKFDAASEYIGAENAAGREVLEESEEALKTALVDQACRWEGGGH